MIRLLVTSGRGPAECRIALAGVLDRLVAEAGEHGLDVDRIDGGAPDALGPGSAIVVVHGDGAPDFARSWVGSVQWIATSPVRPHHKRKNWFVGIFRLEGSALPPALAERDVRFSTMRAGGAGGQHQNKTESAVRAEHLPSGLTVVVRSERSQHRNKAIALVRLAGLLAAQRELEVIADRQRAQAMHDQLERGRPVRRFTGPEFRPG